MVCVSFAIDNLLAVLDKPISDYEGYDIVSALYNKGFGSCLVLQSKA